MIENFIQGGEIDMIDLEIAKKEFQKYLESYNSENHKILIKIQHSYRVMDVSRQIAESLELDEENIQLTELIGLLHDIGRFEQLKIYDTFNDRTSMDHADYGAEILLKDNFIRKFIKDDKYDSTIYKAIKYHNKYKIGEGLNEHELLHAKIIRDADKTDIYEVYIRDIESGATELYDFDKIGKQEISLEVLKCFKEHKLVDKRITKNQADRLISTFAFVFDYNFAKGLELVRDREYIQKIIKRIKTDFNKEKLDMIQESIEKYINEFIANIKKEN